MATTDEGAFEALQRFAAAWHSKYAHVNGGENRKQPSLTMRADGKAAVLTEPQLRAVVAEYARMRQKQAEQRLLAAVFKANRNVPTLAMQHLREAVQHLLKQQDAGVATVDVEAMLDILNPLGIVDPERGQDDEGCLCPHTYQPDGALVRDGVLALGCPVHDPDAGENGDA